MIFHSRIPRIFALLAALLALVPYRTVAQVGTHEPNQPTDPKIAEALRQISAKRIQANIEKLVSFQTRLTLSAQDPDSVKAGHGIGEARRGSGSSPSSSAIPNFAGDASKSRPTVSHRVPPIAFPSPPC